MPADDGGREDDEHDCADNEELQTRVRTATTMRAIGKTPSWTMIAPPLINFGPSLLFPSFPPFRRSSILFYFNFRCLPQKNLKMEPEYGRKERPIRRLREREKTEEADGLTINRVVCPSNPFTVLSTESNDQSVTADSNCSVQSAATAIGAIRADSSFFQSMTSSASYLLPAASDPHWM